LDDRLATFHSLTFANSLRKTWYRFRQYLAATSYVMKLMVLTYQNVRVLRHFRHCRAIGPSQRPKKSQFRALGLYKETLRQSRPLFSPLRSSRNALAAMENPAGKGSLQCAVSEQLPALHANLLEKRPHAATAQIRRRGWRRVGAGLLWLRQAPYRLLWKWKSLWNERKFRAKVRALRRHEQILCVREQYRIATSTQAALFLSLANTIDLKTTTELATLCQHVSKQRRRKKMTTEDLSCFDQTLNAIENNYETLLTTVQ
jgi:hypothetical protein